MLALRDEREESNDRSLAVKRLRDLLVKRRHAGEHAAVGEVFLSCVQVTSFCVCTVANPSMSHVSIFHHSAQWHSETATAPANSYKNSTSSSSSSSTHNHTQPHATAHRIAQRGHNHDAHMPRDSATQRNTSRPAHQAHRNWLRTTIPSSLP